jgi:hypothetical protein
MAYDGWLEYNGVEVVNLSRTAQLAQALGIDTVWTTPESVAWIQTALGGSLYNDISEAPWYDPGYPASTEFAGIVPLSFPGLDDSTMESTPVEYITDGGHSGKPRNATLPIVANVAIIASTDRGADFGKRWMDRVFRSSSDNRVFCSGADLRYFRWEGVDSPIAHRRDVRQTRGSSVTRKRRTDCSATWTVTFTLTAADPFEYSEAFPMLVGLGGGAPYVGQITHTNLADEPNVVSGDRWSLAGATGWTASLDSVTPIRGTVSRRTTVVDTGSGIAGALSLLGPGGTLSWSVVPGAYFSSYMDVRVGVADCIAHLDVDFRDGSNVSVGGTTLGFANLTATVPSRFGGSALVPSTAVSAVLSIQVDDFSGTSVGQTVTYDGLVVELRSTNDGLATYFDGDTAPVGDKVYQWLGSPGVSQSIEAVGSLVPANGSVALVQTTCPVYDYTPVYDPLYPALVPAPTPPDFYPNGWDIEDGMTFTRFWAEVDSIEPTYLDVVPVITLSSSTEARMVRIGIWSGDSDPSDQCGDLLFGAVVTYLPAGVDFIIDGEQKASYVWDGVSTAVRRTDSLVYSFDAKPVDWAKFTDPESLLITLDIFSDSSGIEGDGEVRAALSLVQKSD